MSEQEHGAPASGGAPEADELRMRRAEAILSIAESSPDLIMLVQPDGRILYINHTVPELTVEQVIGTTCFEYIPPEHHDKIRRAFANVCRTGQPEGYESVYISPEGGPMFWESRVHGVFDTSGGVRELAVFSVDVTARRANDAERARLFEMSLDMLVVASTEGYFVRVNEAATRVLGYSREHLLKTPFADLIHPEDREATEKTVALLASGKSVVDFENRYRHQDGNYRLLSWRSTVDVEAGRMYATARDITAQRAAEAHQRQAQKMDAIGQLAGGIAHDFNNLLQVMLGNADIVAARPDLDPAVARRLRHVTDAALRAQALVRQLLAFSRPQPERVTSVDARELTSSVVTLIGRLIPEDIELNVEQAEVALPVDADRSQLEQVVMNLCVNARDAMPQGGTLSLRTAMEEGSPGADGAGKWVCIEVEDTGAGVPVELRERIFEPFFSTKATAGGSGLGLSTAYGIVQQLKGTIEVGEGAGGGALFQVRLPAGVGRPRIASEPRTPSVGVEGRGALLVAEDQEPVREVATEILEDAGYTVYTAADGNEAIAVLEQHGEEIRAALLDVVMPNLGGPEAWLRMRERWPHLRAVFATGYADPGRLGSLADLGATVLRKPYRQEQLLEAIADCLQAQKEET